jgi:heme exporter protein B
LNRLFAADYADGTLEQMALAPTPLAFVVFGKVVAHWVSTGLPLVILSPLVGLQFGLSAEEITVLIVSLLLGTPVLAFLGSIGAALTLGLSGGGVLLALIVLPLYIPVLIFGAGAVSAVAAGQSAAGHLSLLAAFLVVAAFFAPVAGAMALRVALD